MASIKEVKEKAKKLIEQGKYEKGISLYKKIIDKLEEKKNPDIALYNVVGDIYLNKLNNKEIAIEHFRVAMNHYAKSSLYPNAIAMAKKILKIDNNQIDMYKKIGEFNKEQGLLGEAINNFILYAEKSIQNKNIQEAIEAFNATLEMMPDKVEIKEKLVNLYIQENQIEKAIELLKDVESHYVKRNEMEQATLIRQKITKYTKSLSAASAPQTEKPSPEVVRNEPVQTDDIEIDGIDMNELVDDLTKELDSSFDENVIQEDTAKSEDITKEQTPSKSKPESEEELFDSYIDIANLQKDLDAKEALNFYYQGAEGYANLGKYEKAINAYKMILRLKPEDMKAHKAIIDIANKSGNMSMAVDSMNFIAQFEINKNPEEAKRIINAVLSIDPNNQKALSLKATLMPKKSEPIKKEEEFNMDILSEIKSEAESAFEDMDVFKESEHITAKDIINGKNEGNKPKFKVQEEKQEQSDGMWSLNELLDELKEGVNEVIAEDDVSSHYDLGISFKEMGLYDMAIEEFNKSLKDKDYEFKSLEMLGQCYLEQNMFDQAENILIKALSMKGKQQREYLGIKYALALLYENKGMYDESLKLYNEIIAVDKNFKDVNLHIENINKKLSMKTKQKKAIPAAESNEFIDFSELLKDDETTSTIQELQSELDNIEIDLDEDEGDNGPSKTKNITYM